MQWPDDTQLHQMAVIAAPYGGPMAIVRDSKQFIKVGGSTVKPVIRIFTAAGNQLAAINVRIEIKFSRVMTNSTISFKIFESVLQNDFAVEQW